MRYFLNFLKILLLAYLIFIVTNFNNNIFSNHDLIGSWYSNLDNNEIKLLFNFDNSFSLSLINKINSDSSSSYKGFYTTDFNKSPVSLDLKKIKDINYSMFTVLNFINKDSIRMAFFSLNKKTRDISLSDNNSFGLRKVSK